MKTEITDEKKDKLIVSKSDYLVRQAKHELTAKELTLVDFMISNVKQTDNKFYTVETTIDEINSICNFGEGGGSSTKNTEDALLSLANKGFYLKLDNGYKTVARWLDKPYIKDGECKLQLDKDLAPFLLNLSKENHFTQYYFLDVVNLKSIHAKRIYQLLRSYDYSNEVELSTTEITETLNKTGLEWYRVLNYLRSAVKNITKNTSMNVTYNTIKSGRETIAVRFNISMKERYLIETPQ